MRARSASVTQNSITSTTRRFLWETVYGCCRQTMASCVLVTPPGKKCHGCLAQYGRDLSVWFAGQFSPTRLIGEHLIDFRGERDCHLQEVPSLTVRHVGFD